MSCIIRGRVDRTRATSVARRSGEAQHLGRLAGTDGRELAAESQPIAKHGGHGVGIGVATDVAEESLVIDVAERLVAEVEGLPQSHREDAGGKGGFEWLAHAEVGGDG